MFKFNLNHYGFNWKRSYIDVYNHFIGPEFKETRGISIYKSLPQFFVAKNWPLTNQSFKCENHIITPEDLLDYKKIPKAIGSCVSQRYHVLSLLLQKFKEEFYIILGKSPAIDLEGELLFDEDPFDGDLFDSKEIGFSECFPKAPNAYINQDQITLGETIIETQSNLEHWYVDKFLWLSNSDWFLDNFTEKFREFASEATAKEVELKEHIIKFKDLNKLNKKQWFFFS